MDQAQPLPRRRLGGRPRAARLVGLVIAAASIGWTAATPAGQVHRGAAAGFTVTIDTRWYPGPGYRPIPIEVRPTAQQSADRTLTVEFLSRGPGPGGSYCVRAVEDIEIPAGSGAVRAVVRVPQSLGREYRVDVIEDGLLIPGLSVQGMVDADANAGPHQGLPRAVGVAWNQRFTKILTKSPGPVAVLDGTLLSGVAPLALRDVPKADLPPSWLDYSNLDIVCISLDQLLELGDSTTRQAFVRWTRAGGNLFVYAVGRKWERLPELEKILSLPPSRSFDAPRSGWTNPDKSLFGEPLKGFVSEDYDYGGPVEVSPSPGRKPELPPVPDEAHFVYRDYGMGAVVALAPSDLFAGGEHEWRWLFNALGPERLVWAHRHGLSMTRENADFWNFLIPGVGLPPVNAFRVLITLFVVIIGPVNYFLLRRWGKLHLLLVIVPASAALVTVALFGYALIADGLGTRVRARSYTEIDQRNGEAVCWSRLSYYAGLAPRRGLAFSDDVAVLPLEYLPADPGSRRRDVFWDSQLHLTGGWLRARTPTQLLTVRARKIDYGLDFHPSPEDPDSLVVENRLRTRIQDLVVRSSDGQYFEAQTIRAGGTASLVPSDPAKAAGRLRLAAVEHTPEFPPGTDRQTLAAAAASRNYRRRIFRPRGYGEVDANQATSRLEKSLAAAAHSAQTDRPLLGPASYIALVDHSPEVELGTPSAAEEASFHVIRGQW